MSHLESRIDLQKEPQEDEGWRGGHACFEYVIT